MASAVLGDVNEDGAEGDHACRDEEGLCRMQEGSFECIWIVVESGDQKPPDEEIECDVDQEDHRSNGIQAPKAKRDCSLLAF